MELCGAITKVRGSYGYEVTRLEGYKVRGLQGHRVTGLQGLLLRKKFVGVVMNINIYAEPMPDPLPPLVSIFTPIIK